MRLWSLILSIRNEFRGWRKFNQATGKWPAYSILADVLSIPLLFAGGMYIGIAAEKKPRGPLAYLEVFFIVLGTAAAWYGIRRIACKLDVARGMRSSAGQRSTQALEEFLR